jgi:hypothetical protein
MLSQIDFRAILKGKVRILQQCADPNIKRAQMG